jgi:exopolysaccharide biosynthesis polyprenyl glycosylphosphotransferase
MSRTRFIWLSMIVDALTFNAGVVAAFLIRFGGELPAYNVGPYVTLAPYLTLILLLVAYVYGLYDPERIEGVWPLVRGAFAAAAVTMLLTLGVLQLAGQSYDAFPRLVIVLAAPLHLLLLFGWRVGAMRLTPVRWPEQRVLVVGTGALARELASELAGRSRWGYNVLGFVSRDEDPPDPGPMPEGLRVLGTVHDLTRLVETERVDRVIVASPVALRELVEDITLKGEVDVRVDVVPELYEIFIGAVDSIVADIPLMEITHRSPRWYVTAKRVFDVVFALVLLVALSPVLALTAFAILVSMGWPVLFTQERVGKDMKTFRVLKFRTMVRDAESESGPVLAVEEDPRVTPLGRALRTYRIDEFPQIANILAGQMSFVGPRPERPVFVEEHLERIPGYRERFRIKPGVTGLAQVSGSYATTAARKLKYDLIYMYHQNLLMDVQILAQTVQVVLTGRGAR